MSRIRAIAPFLLLASLWGLSFPAISVGLDVLPPILFAAYRYDVAAVLLLLAAATRAAGREWVPTARSDRLAVAAGGVFLVAGNAFLFLGQQTVPSGIAAITQALVPIATALWALAILPEEWVTPAGAVGIAVGFLGVGLVVRPDPANLFGSDLVGKLLILMQVTSVALGGVLIQRAGPSLERTALSGWSMALGALLLHGASVATGESVVVPSGLALGAVAYLGVFATAFAFFLYFTLLARYGALETSLVTYAVPVVATLAGVFFLNERIAPMSLIGFLVIFVGFLLLKRRAIATLLGV